tara:strand:+ start:110 stop:469 length:360 start_codon:yes stop_codon:yes gene_type:complete
MKDSQRRAMFAKNAKCEYGQVFGDCGENSNRIRVAHHLVSEDNGKTNFGICSNCLDHFFCSESDEISHDNSQPATFGYYDPINLKVTDEPSKNLKLTYFDAKKYQENIKRRTKKGIIRD